MVDICTVMRYAKQITGIGYTSIFVHRENSYGESCLSSFFECKKMSCFLSSGN